MHACMHAHAMHDHLAPLGTNSVMTLLLQSPLLAADPRAPETQTLAVGGAELRELER